MMLHTHTSIGTRIHTFWFQPVSASGFGLMRIAFSFTALLKLLMQIQNVQRFYGPEGILPREMAKQLLRQEWRFSLLDHVGALGTTLLYWLLLCCLFFVLLGIGTRLALLISLILFYSFYEYGAIIHDSGDSLMSIIGFILLLAPCDHRFTIKDLWHRCMAKSAGKKELSPLTMPIWPYRLLLWQIVIMYMISAYGKMAGETWPGGTAVAMAIHHVHFARFPMAFADWFSRFSPLLSFSIIYAQLAWGALLVLPILRPIGIHIGTVGLKLFLIAIGILIHGGIFLIMDVETFSLAIFTAYLGLLLDEDFSAMRRLVHQLLKLLRFSEST